MHKSILADLIAMQNSSIRKSHIVQPLHVCVCLCVRVSVRVFVCVVVCLFGGRVDWPGSEPSVRDGQASST